MRSALWFTVMVLFLQGCGDGGKETTSYSLGLKISSNQENSTEVVTELLDISADTGNVSRYIIQDWIHLEFETIDAMGNLRTVYMNMDFPVGVLNWLEESGVSIQDLEPEDLNSDQTFEVDVSIGMFPAYNGQPSEDLRANIDALEFRIIEIKEPEDLPTHIWQEVGCYGVHEENIPGDGRIAILEAQETIQFPDGTVENFVVTLEVILHKQIKKYESFQMC